MFFFFMSCPLLPTFLVHCVVMLTPLLHCANFFVCLFLQKLICSPAISRHLLVNLEAAFYLTCFADGKNIIKQVRWVYV